MFVSDIKEMLEKIQDDMIEVAICIPAFLPHDCDEKLYESLKNLEDELDNQILKIEEIDGSKIISEEEKNEYLAFSSYINEIVLAARSQELRELHREYDQIVEHYDYDNRMEVLMFKKINIYNTFISNLIAREV